MNFHVTIKQNLLGVILITSALFNFHHTVIAQIETPQPTDSPTQDTSGTIPSYVKLPDLQTLPITDLQLVIDSASGKRLIRFTNQILNGGPGLLELRGQKDPQSDNMAVEQVLEGEPDFLVSINGTFYYDLHHAHWHWEGFAAYEIWTVIGRQILDQRVVENEKVGVCMFDTYRMDKDWISENMPAGLTIRSDPSYQTCGIHRQGLSSGWVDVYTSDLPGQSLDISGLQDGIYALRSVVDPHGSIHEVNIDNNEAIFYFMLEGDTLTILEPMNTLYEYFAQRLEKKSYQIIDELAGMKY